MARPVSFTYTPTGAFWLYALMCGVTLAIVWRAVPETKGRSLEEIERSWLVTGRRSSELPSD